MASELPNLPQGYQVATGPASRGTEYRLTGFPKDGPEGGRTMMEGRSRIAKTTNDRLLHRVDTDEGQSGSPVWSNDGSTFRVAAVHNEGTTASYGHEFLANGAVLLTKNRCDWISAQATAGSGHQR